MARRPGILRSAAMAFTRSTVAAVSAATETYLSALGQAMTQSVLYPSTREIGYHLNQLSSNVVPDVPAVLQALYAERLTEQQARTLLGYHGVDWQFARPVGEGTYTVQAWKHIVDVGRPALGLDTYADLWRQGHITGQDYASFAKRTGLRDSDIDLLLSQTGTLDIGTATDLRNQGLLDDAQLGSIIERNGITNPDYRAGLLAQREPIDLPRIRNNYYLGIFTDAESRAWLSRAGYGEPATQGMLLYEPDPFDPVEALQMFYRGEIDEDTLFKHIKASKTGLHGETEKYVRAMRPMPTPSDLVTLAVRDAWNADAVQRFGYDEEFPEPFRYFMQRQGMDWGEQVPPMGGQQYEFVKWPLAYWRAHWQLISPTQAYECFHRLRPGRSQRFAGAVPGIRDFDIGDLRTILKTADYPPPMRDWLAAIAFQPLRLFDIRNAFMLGVRDRAWVIEQLRDRGLTLEDATTSARIIEAQKQKADMAPIASLQRQISLQALKGTVQAYVDGYLTRDDAKTMLMQTGMGDNSANQWLLNAEIGERHKQIQNVVSGIQADYFMGAISPDEALVLLRTTGIVGPKIAALLRQWDIERSLKHRMATSSEILGYVKQGLMTPADAQVRLANLGWNAADALLALQSAQHALAVAQGRQAKAAEQAAAQKAKQLQQAQKELKAASKKVAQDLRALTPLAQLKSWFVDGVVGEKYIVERMTAELYPADIIRRYLEDWTPQRKKKEDAKSKRGKQASPATPAPPGGAMQGG